VWEIFVAFIRAMIRYMTVSHYLNSLVYHAVGKQTMPAELALVDEAPLSACVVVLATLWVAFLAFSVWRFVTTEFHENPERR
jgi:hypothetical protein